jgi:hypothetical protein
VAHNVRPPFPSQRPCPAVSIIRTAGTFSLTFAFRRDHPLPPLMIFSLSRGSRAFGRSGGLSGGRSGKYAPQGETDDVFRYQKVCI